MRKVKGYKYFVGSGATLGIELVAVSQPYKQGKQFQLYYYERETGCFHQNIHRWNKVKREKSI